MVIQMFFCGAGLGGGGGLIRCIMVYVKMVNRQLTLGKIIFNRAIVLYNSLTTAREQIVSLHVSDPAVMV